MLPASCIYYPFHHELESPFSITNQSHTVMNSARPQTTLSDLKSTTFTQQQVLGRHTHVHKIYLSMASCQKRWSVYGPNACEIMILQRLQKVKNTLLPSIAEVPQLLAVLPIVVTHQEGLVIQTHIEVVLSLHRAHPLVPVSYSAADAVPL